MQKCFVMSKEIHYDKFQNFINMSASVFKTLAYNMSKNSIQKCFIGPRAKLSVVVAYTNHLFN